MALDPVASNPRAVMNPPASQASPVNPASQKAPGTPTATPRHGSPTPRTRTRTNGGGAHTTDGVHGGAHTTDGQAS